MIGWMSNWDYAQKVPTNVWRSAMTLPREIMLHADSGGYSIRSLPVAELEVLDGGSYNVRPQVVSDKLQVSVPAEMVTQSRIDAEFETPSIGTKVSIALSNRDGETFRVGYDGESGEFFSDRRKAGVSEFSDKFATSIDIAPRVSLSKSTKMRIYVDHDSVELFADDGQVVMTSSVFPTTPYTAVTLTVKGNPLALSQFEITNLKSIH